MQRLWLTPLFRTLFRIGLPLALIGGPVALYLADDARRAALVTAAAAFREDFQNRPEFMVSLISVEGAAPELAEAIRSRLNLTLPQSSFDIDLAAAQDRVQALDAVARVEIAVRAGGVLQVAITERTPALVWRNDGGLDLVDAAGHRVASLAARADRADLPLIAGVGAAAAAPEALELIAAAAPVAHRIRGLVRVGERRWDIALDRDQRILLPEGQAAALAALQRFLAEDARADILNRDVADVDLRLAHRPVIRLTPYAGLQLRRGRGLEPMETDL
jgi:cell division protein FtsQ